MCWTGNATAIKKIAERDFYVYKIGKVVWNNIFVSDIRGYVPNKIVPYHLYGGRIDRGYHSYKWIALDDYYPNFRCLCLGSYDPALRESLEGFVVQLPLQFPKVPNTLKISMDIQYLLKLFILVNI